MEPDSSNPMTSMNISLPESLRTFIDNQVSSGYGSASEYIRELVRNAQKEVARARLEELLLEGLESGAPEATGEEYFTGLIEHIRARAAKRRSTPEAG